MEAVSINKSPAPIGFDRVKGLLGNMREDFCLLSNLNAWEKRTKAIRHKIVERTNSTSAPAKAIANTDKLISDNLNKGNVGASAFSGGANFGEVTKAKTMKTAACTATATKAMRQFPKVAKVPPTIGPAKADMLQIADTIAKTFGNKAESNHCLIATYARATK